MKKRTKIKGWAVIDKDGDKTYILFTFNSDGEPILSVFDFRHERWAKKCKTLWQKAYHPTARLVPCEITLTK